MLSYVSFLRILVQEFDRLMDPRNLDDALQEWALLEASCPGGVPLEAARQAMRILEYELGLTPRKPRRIPRAALRLPEVVDGDLIADLGLALGIFSSAAA